MKILKYTDYSISNEMVEFLIRNIESPIINESIINKEYVKKILTGLSKDLNFNISLVFTFGTGIAMMIPIVDNLIKNGNIKIDATKENLILLSLTALAILYLEETKNKSGESEIECKCKSRNCNKCMDGKIKSKVTKSDAQTLLEELKMRGIGNGIVKKFVKSFKSIGNLIKVLFRNSKYPIKGLLEMFGYASLMIPIMNAIGSLIGKYEMNADTIIGNFLSIGAGIMTFLAKNSLDFLIDKLKKKVDIEDSKSDDESPMYDIMDGDGDNIGKLINEQ
jgi:hypothetical protein